MRNQENDIAKDQKLLSLAANLRMPAPRSKEAVWRKLELHLSSKGKIIHISAWMKVAASVLVIVISGFLLYQFQQVEIATNRGQQLEVYLPDGTSVLLNSESTLSYNTLSWGFRRTVLFEGEAYFQVLKGDRFLVKSTSGCTQVLGTSFNINTHHQNYEVSCTSGKVQVTLANNQIHTLTPGLQVSSRDRSKAPQQFDENKTLAWRKGEFYFEAETLSKVFRTIERQYNVLISAEGINVNRIYTGFFSNRDIEETLKVVCLPMGLNYQIIDARTIKIYHGSNV